MGIRRLLAVMMVVMGVSATWAWGEVARLAPPPPATEQPQPVSLYAAWRLEGSEQPTLQRSDDKGLTWQPLALPGGAVPRAWADDGGRKLAVATEESSVLWSSDRGETWKVVVQGLGVSSLAWDQDGSGLYLGASGQGVFRLEADGTLADLTTTQGGLATARIVDLSLAAGHLFAATPTRVYHTGDSGATWTASAPLSEGITAVTAIDPQTVYAGTATTGVFRSDDAGLTWQPAWDGLGLAAGQMVRVTAMRADRSEPGLLYVTVDHVLGGTQAHASAAGLFVSVDGGTSWQPLAGPSFPEARPATGLVLVPDKALQARAVSETGLQRYAPDIVRLLAALESDDAKMRASAARQLGLARPAGVWNELLAALDDPDMAVSLAASEALGRINDPAAVPGLLIAVQHPIESMRLGAARALGLMGVEAAVEPLQAMLLWGTASEVGVAGEALGRIGGSAATDALLAALADARPTARWHAAMAALEELGEPAVDPLVAMLDSRDIAARRNAAEALGWIGSPAATDALARALRQDGDAGVRGQAAWALGEIGDPSARRALERASQRDPAGEVQAAAGWALSRVPVQAAAPASWTAGWAPALAQLQPARWLVLALSLAGAAWLMMGNRSLVLAQHRLRHRHR